MTTEKKQTTAGIVITDGEIFLVGHVTNGKHWSIPKGIIDNGETPIQAAIRETEEETGIIIAPEHLTYLGTHPYRDKKDMALFIYKTDKSLLPPTSMMKCDSVVMISDTEGFPEIDQFAYISFSMMEQYINKKMYELFTKIDLENTVTNI